VRIRGSLRERYLRHTKSKQSPQPTHAQESKKPKNGGVGQWPGCLSQDFQGGAKNKPKRAPNNPLPDYKKPEKIELKGDKNPPTKAKKTYIKNKSNRQKFAQRITQRRAKKKKKETASIAIQSHYNMFAAVIHSMNIH